MDFAAFLERLKEMPTYRGQIVECRRFPAREAQYAETEAPLSPAAGRALKELGIERLFSHQAEAIDAIRRGEDVVLATGTASGKSLCYQIAALEMLERDPRARALLLFPTKALAQDQLRAFHRVQEAARMPDLLAGTYDGDTPANMRRKLRDQGSLILSNPDMLHATVMPQHPRWAEFFQRLRYVVVDEMHVYSGLFGSNVANLFRRFLRVCAHYGSEPRFLLCSATIANPRELAERLIGRTPTLIDRDSSPAGARVFVFWNPPRIRRGRWRSRRSANVEAHEVTAALIKEEIPTITFSKAKVTAELIHRYVREELQKTAPSLADRITPYRAGYLPEERREIEKRLFGGELIGVSTTRALELGIDVGGLDASVIVGYPGTLASFFQQAGRAGRRESESLVVLVGLDTTVNQYVMNHPEYIFGRPIEEAVIDADNPYVVCGHVRCAAQELPLSEEEVDEFGTDAGVVADVLEQQQKLHRIDDRWYHSAPEIPQHEVSLRDYADVTVTIVDASDNDRVIGQVNQFDAPPILHPGAIYLHQGESYLVKELDLVRNIASVEKAAVDYYTQPLGGTDIHHIDQPLREKPFGTGRAYFGEVTAYFQTAGYERVHFYTLDAISRHDVNLPTYVLETMAVWIVPPQDLMREVTAAGLDAHAGLRGIGYATRMMLPLFVTCETLDFSHTVGSANSPWHTVFIYERYPRGLGFTEHAYEVLGDILPVVTERVRACDCEDGCPCCVGKPLRQYAVWNVERGEASVPSKAAALMIFDGLLGDGSRLHEPDADSLGQPSQESRLRLERGLQRRLERMREPVVFHDIEPRPEVAYPAPEAADHLESADVARRAFRRRRFEEKLRLRAAKEEATRKQAAESRNEPEEIRHGDAVAAKARRLKRKREAEKRKD